VATFAGVVTLVEVHLLDALGVAALAGRELRERAAEVVRLVAARARRAAMRAVVGVGELVARGARLHVHHVLHHAVRMRVVAADASAGLLRVIGVHGLVARGAGGGGRRLDVVGGVAVRAAVVGADAAAADHVERLVTGAAGLDLLLFEVVGLVTGGARRVPVVEERGGGDERLLLRVALDAGCERILGGCVPILVAAGAGFDE